MGSYKQPIVPRAAVVSVAAAVLLAAGAASAGPTLGSGSYLIKYQNWEQVLDDLVINTPLGDVFNVPTCGVAGACSNDVQDLRGILQITNIFQPAGSAQEVFGDGDNGEHLWGVFYGLNLKRTTIDPVDGDINNEFEGGFLDVYVLPANLDPHGLLGPADGVSNWTSDSTFAPINDANGNGIADNIEGGGFEHWLSARFDAGILEGETPGSTTTLSAIIDSATVPATGSGAGFLSVTNPGDAGCPTGAAAGEAGCPNGAPGTVNIQIDTDAVADAGGGLHDALLQNDFQTITDVGIPDGLDDNTFIPCDTNPNPPGIPAIGLACVRFQGGWHLTSQDPVTGVAIPEPASVLLLGAGLLGLGYTRRRRRG